MSLQIHYLCSYYSQWAHNNLAPRSQALWDAYKFCLAVKSLHINGSCVAPTKKPVTITADNVEWARILFGRFIRQKLKSDLSDDTIIVPVPSKDSWNTDNFRSLQMTRDSLPWMAERVVPLIRFGQERTRAAAGGERGYGAVKPFLIKGTTQYPSNPIILVDDILTTGGSMLAAKDFLTEQGANVRCAVVCGKTTTAIEPAFKMRDIELEDHLGDLDF